MNEDETKNLRLQDTMKAVDVVAEVETACQKLEETIRTHLVDVLENCHEHFQFNVTVQPDPMGVQHRLLAHVKVYYSSDMSTDEMSAMDRKVEQLFSDFGLLRLKIWEQRNTTRWQFFRRALRTEKKKDEDPRAALAYQARQEDRQRREWGLA